MDEQSAPAATAEPVGDAHAQPDGSTLKGDGAGSHLHPVGYVDVMNRDRVTGWAWDPLKPAESVELEVWDGGEYIMTFKADLFRADLVTAGLGDGRHAFFLPDLGRLLKRTVQLISIRRAGDRRELGNSPQWVFGFDLTNDIGESGLIGNLASAVIDCATDAQDLDRQLTLFVSATQRLIEAQRAMRLAGDQKTEAGAAAEVSSFLHALRQQYPPLHLPEPQSPRVSVIIPVYNQFALTYACLKSIVETQNQTEFEIIVVDDYSNDDTMLAGLVLSGAVRIARRSANAGFIAACNQGAGLAQGEFLLFLNNDTLVRPGWLDELVDTFERVPDAGIVGSRLLFEDGVVQDAGGLVWREGDAWNLGRGRDRGDPRFCVMRDVDYVTGAALMIKAALFRSLGGFDAVFSPAYYEDTDLAFRVRQQGFRVLVQPASEIVHLEGGTGGRDPAGTNVKRYQRINQATFHKRWKHVLANHRLNGHEPEREMERLVQRRAYFVDDTVPTPDQDAGSNAAVQHMLALQGLGYKVTFIPADNMARIDPYTKALEKLGIECVYAPYYDSAERFFRASNEAPDLIYFHRFSNAFKYAALCRHHFGKVLQLYSVADLHFIRMERQAVVEERRSLAREAQEMRERELQVMRLVDTVIVHSEFEAERLRTIDSGLDVAVLKWAVKVRQPETDIAKRWGVAFVGGFAHPPNVDSALFLAKQIVPRLRAAKEPIPCTIVGSKVPKEVLALRSSSIDVAGFVPDLATLFESIRCTIAPLRFGAGIKGKVLESFAYGTPCVMSEIAAEGLGLPDELLWLVATTPEEFADKVIALHGDGDMARRLGQACQQFIQTQFSAEIIREQLRQIIEQGPERLLPAQPESDDGATPIKSAQVHGALESAVRH